MGDLDPKAAIDRFLADNPELEQLNAELAQFNVFRALRIEYTEIRHSNTLAWLCDPRGSHGLDDICLRRLLSNMLLGMDIEGISAAHVEMMDLSDVEVRREWHNTDVLILIHSEPNLAVLIENKVRSKEGDGQLVRYRSAIAQEFPDFKLVPVFLTLDGLSSDDDEASDFIVYSYVQILDVLGKVLAQRRSQMPDAVAIFFDQYIATLRRLTMKDERLAELCKKIYRQHKDAIDLIVELGGSAFERVAKEVFEVDGSFEILASGRSQTRFIPKSWSPLIPSNGTGWRNLSRPVSVACLLYKNTTTGKLRLIAEVSSMDDPKLRLECIERLKASGFTPKKMAMRQDAKYSRFFTLTSVIKDWADEKEIKECITKLLAKAKPEWQRADAVFKRIFGGAKNSKR